MDSVSIKLPSGFNYTGVKPDQLTSYEYTAATIVFDESGSTKQFSKDMENCEKEIVKSLRESPRADNLVLRCLHFGTNLREQHGFKPLADCNPNDYDNSYHDGGSTALFDACISAIEATTDYAEQLAKQRYSCNGIVVVITDGDDCSSKFKAHHVRDVLTKAVGSEVLESVITILIGVNMGNSNCKGLLDKFQKDAGITQFVSIDTADAGSLAKVAGFISNSIKAQSKALSNPGSKAASLTF